MIRTKKKKFKNTKLLIGTTEKLTFQERNSTNFKHRKLKLPRDPNLILESTEARVTYLLHHFPLN